MSKIDIITARVDNREVSFAFCAHTWDWGDYIERKWDDWLHDTQGRLLICTCDEHPTAIARLLMVTKNDAWLEELRVDPHYRRQGQALALAKARIAEAMRRGATHIRAITASENMAARRIFKRLHMRQAGGFVPFTASPWPELRECNVEGETMQLATLNDLDDIIDHFKVSPVGGFYYADFAAYVVTAELLQQQLEARQIYLFRSRGRLEGLAIAEPRQMEELGMKHMSLSVGYINGATTEAIRLLASGLSRRLLPLGLEAIFVYASDLALVRNALTGINYRWSGHVFSTYERELSSVSSQQNLIKGAKDRVVL